MNKKIWNLIWDAIKESDSKLFRICVVNSLVQIIAWSFVPILFKNIADMIQNKDISGFWFWIKVWIIYSIFFYVVQERIVRWCNWKFQITLWDKVYQKMLPSILTIDWQLFENKWSSRIENVFWEWRSSITNMATKITSDIIPAIFRIVFAFVFIFIYTEVKFFFLSLIVFGVYVYILYKTELKWVKLWKKQNEIIRSRDRHRSKLMNSKTEALVSGKIASEMWKLHNMSMKNLKLFLERLDLYIIPNTRKLLRNLSIYGTYIYFFHQFIIDKMTFGTYYIISTSIDRIFNNISDVTSLSADINNYYQKLQDLQTEIVEAPQMIGYHEGQKYIYQSGDIKIDNISFAYTKFAEKISKKDRWDEKTVEIVQDSEIIETTKPLKYIFENFSMNIVWWSKVAFVWPSGGGKTTLVKLIIWLLNTNNGSIYIDGQKLPNSYTTSEEYISLSSYYAHVGYLSQDPWIFDASVLDNLLYGLAVREDNDDELDNYKSNKSDNISDIYNKLDEFDQRYFTEEVLGILSKYIPVPRETAEYNENGLTDLIQKIKSAMLDSSCNFIRDYDKGLLTQVGERWVKLSGGQKQRLAIAKLMIKDPAIIILDEPTSALDSFSEEGVTAAMERLFENRTTIIIAHRLQTVRKADKIVYIEDGKIIESWKHQDLLDLWWKYYQMVDLQSGF